MTCCRKSVREAIADTGQKLILIYYVKFMEY